VQSGQYFWGRSAGKNWAGNFYFSFLADEVIALRYAEYEQQLLSCLDRVFARLVGSIDKKQTVILPLSGGYDSRLIAVMLKKNGYEHVICYTFGKKDSFETINSEKIAAELGYEWHFVATTYEELDHFVADKTFHEYMEFAANYSSFPIMQDYFAVKKLKEEGIFPEKAVVIPGHSGAVVGALLKDYTLNDATVGHEDICREILSNEYLFSRRAPQDIETMREKILTLLPEKGLPHLKFENYIFRERESKLITNAVRVYEFFGYEHRMPLWDQELLNLYLKMPYELKFFRKLYIEVLNKHIFGPLNLRYSEDFQVPVVPTEEHKNRDGNFVKLKTARLKTFLKKFIPVACMRYYRKKIDYVCGFEITEVMRKDLNKKKVKVIASDTNSIIGQWYLNFLKEKHR